MITISNGWLNNTISYSRINKIADAARAKARPENTSESIRVDHSRDMDLSEIIYDYLFCASVKKEYMDNLYAMVYRIERIGVWHAKDDAQKLLRSADRINYSKDQMEGIWGAPSPSDPVESRMGRRRNQYIRAMIETELPLARVMSGNSLRYARNPLDNSAGDKNYLIFRDQCRRIQAGIPITSQFSTAPRTSSRAITSALDTYHDLDEIQVSCLETVRQSQSLTLRNHTYEVRFTKDREPIVLVADDVVLTESLQKRLSNLWAIENVQQRLNELREHTFRTTEPDLCRLAQISEDMPDIYVTAMVALDAKFDQECEKIERALFGFEFNLDLDWAAKQAFKELQEKIGLLENVKSALATRVDCFKEKIEAMHEHALRYGFKDDHPDTRHLVNLFDQETGFILATASVFWVRR